MARQYAISNELPGLSGSVVTYVDGQPLDEGDPLGDISTFDIRYFYTIRVQDKSGNVFEYRQMAEIQDVPVTASQEQIIKNIKEARGILTKMGTAQIGAYPEFVYRP